MGSFWNLHLDSNIIQRSYHATVMDSERMYIFGGEIFDGNSESKVDLLNSFLSFSLESGDFEKIDVKLYSDDSKNKITDNNYTSNIDTSNLDKFKFNDFTLPTNEFSNLVSNYEFKRIISNDTKTLSFNQTKQISQTVHFKLPQQNLDLGEVPPMSRHTMNYINIERDQDQMNDGAHAYLVVFGGIVDIQEQKSSNDLYAFDLNRRQWRKINQTGYIPKKRHEHTSSVIGQKMYLFGGTDFEDYFGDLSIFDFTFNSWIQAKTHGKSPAKRSGHSAVVHGTSLYIFGGGNNEKMFNDIFVLDTDTLTWREIKIANTFSPTQRLHHTANVVGNRMIVFGGTGKNNTENEVLSFDFDDLKWRKEEIESSEQAPPPLVGHSSVASNSKIWIFGGTQERNNIKVNTGQLFVLETNMKCVPPIFVPSSTLSEDLGTLVNDSDVSDFIFEMPDGQYYYAHKAILQIRCPYLFLCCLKNQNDDIIYFNNLINYIKMRREQLHSDKLDDVSISFDAFDETMEYIYSEQLPNLSKFSYSLIEEIIYFSQLLNLERLHRYLVSYIQPTSNIIISAPTLTLNLRKLFQSVRDSSKSINQTSNTLIDPKSKDLSIHDITVTNTYKCKSELRIDDNSMNSEEYLGEVTSSDEEIQWRKSSLKSSMDDPQEMHDSISDYSSNTIITDTVSIISETYSGFTSVAIDSKNFLDVEIQIDNCIIPAHRCILIARSEYFRHLLITDNPDKPYKKFLTLNNIRPEIFMVVLEYLYVDDVEIPYSIALEVLMAAEEFNLNRLSLLCQQVLERKILVHNSCQFLTIAEEYNLLHLKKTCAFFIVHHLSQVRKVRSYKILPNDMKHELKLLRKQLKNEDNYDYENEGTINQVSRHKKHKKKKSNFRKSYLNQPKKPKKKKKKEKIIKDASASNHNSSYSSSYPNNKFNEYQEEYNDEYNDM